MASEASNADDERLHNPLAAPAPVPEDQVRLVRYHGALRGGRNPHSFARKHTPLWQKVNRSASRLAPLRCGQDLRKVIGDDLALPPDLNQSMARSRRERGTRPRPPAARARTHPPQHAGDRRRAATAGPSMQASGTPGRGPAPPGPRGGPRPRAAGRAPSAGGGERRTAGGSSSADPRRAGAVLGDAAVQARGAVHAVVRPGRPPIAGRRARAAVRPEPASRSAAPEHRGPGPRGLPGEAAGGAAAARRGGAPRPRPLAKTPTRGRVGLLRVAEDKIFFNSKVAFELKSAAGGSQSLWLSVGPDGSVAARPWPRRGHAASSGAPSRGRGRGNQAGEDRHGGANQFVFTWINMAGNAGDQGPISFGQDAWLCVRRGPGHSWQHGSVIYCQMRSAVISSTRPASFRWATSAHSRLRAGGQEGQHGPDAGVAGRRGHPGHRRAATPAQGAPARRDQALNGNLHLDAGEPKRRPAAAEARAATAALKAEEAMVKGKAKGAKRGKRPPSQLHNLCEVYLEQDWVVLAAESVDDERGSGLVEPAAGVGGRGFKFLGRGSGGRGGGTFPNAGAGTVGRPRERRAARAPARGRSARAPAGRRPGPRPGASSSPRRAPSPRASFARTPAVGPRCSTSCTHGRQRRVRRADVRRMMHLVGEKTQTRAAARRKREARSQQRAEAADALADDAGGRHAAARDARRRLPGGGDAAGAAAAVARATSPRSECGPTRAFFVGEAL